MRKPMMAGNWKMNKTPKEAIQLAKDIDRTVAGIDNVVRVICPTYISIPGVTRALENSPVAVGAQNVHWEENGAYTGEISASMLEGLVQYVIIGHSERRGYFQETDQQVNRKVKAAIRHGLRPILCVGESLEQNEAAATESVVSGQVRAALDSLDERQVQSLIVAYEPIWAIGTGRAATEEQANNVCGNVVRMTLRTLLGDDVATNTTILYGGSTKPANIRKIMEQPDIDGALIGGASLDAKSFCDMVKITSELYS